MNNPLGTRHPIRRVLLVAWAVIAAPGCSNDDPASAPVGVAAGGGASADAGPTDTGAAGASSAGAAGSGSSPGIGGTAGNEPDAGPPEPPTGCTPGEELECVFDQLCTGTQVCDAEGNPGACVCSTAALTGTGAVGARCASDADCAGGGTCFGADQNLYQGQGGPAGGYCTFPCTRDEQGVDDCGTHDGQSFCAPIGPEGATYCLRTCLSLEPGVGEAKCLNRPDLVCVSLAADGEVPFDGQPQLGYCRPMCGSDEECPAGRSCHAQGKICTVGQYPGNPIGAACSLDTDCSGNSCEGQNDENVGVCSASCVLGVLSGCGYGRDPESRDAACLTPVVAASGFSEGPGDLGFCRELCDVAEDCEQAAAGWICTPLTPTASEYFGRSGACVPGP
jgi:hypothetical protein